MSDIESKLGTLTSIPGTPIIINAGASTKATEPTESAEDRRTRREDKLAEARAEGANDVLKSLGVKKSERARMVEEIKAGRMKLSEAREEVAAAKKEVEAKTAEVDAFKPYKDQVEALTTTLKKYADLEFSSLPEPFQKALATMKLEDPKARLDMIEVWKSTGIITPTQAKDAKTEIKTEAKAASTAAPIIKPSNTMATAPNTQSPPGPVANHYEAWQQLRNQGHHYLAAQYWNAHQTKILEQRPTT